MTKKNRLTNKEQTVKREHRGIIFASLFTIIKNKMGDIFLSGQNKCHITGRVCTVHVLGALIHQLQFFNELIN